MIKEQEIPKYLKQKESNMSKANKKSKHKHYYEECLIQYNFIFARKKHLSTSLSSYCIVCGKIGDRFKEDKSIVKDFTRIIDTPIGKCYSIIPDEELYEEYHDRLPVFFVKDIYKDKYVNLEEKNQMQGRNHKTVPGEPTEPSKENKSQKETNRNITFAILGAFLFGLGCDLELASIGSIGIALIIVSLFSSI